MRVLWQGVIFEVRSVFLPHYMVQLPGKLETLKDYGIPFVPLLVLGTVPILATLNGAISKRLFPTHSEIHSAIVFLTMKSTGGLRLESRGL